MRITVRLGETLLERVRQEVAKRRATLASLIGVRAATTHESGGAAAGGGTLPGIDLNDSASLLDRMDERD